MSDNVIPILPPHMNPKLMYLKALAWYHSGGMPKGSSTGWPMLDPFYTVGSGHWTVITGFPGSGKSEWLDAMLVNLAEKEDWIFAMYSPENVPTEGHLAKLIEKRVRKPFGAGPTPRMTVQEYEEGANWVFDNFLWLKTEAKSPEALLEAATRYSGQRKLGVVLDPWNTLEHQRGGMTETDYTSFVLTGVTQLAREANAHVWLVVHPTKIQRNKDGTRPVPTPYDISGSAHWYNKADNIITVHRDQDGGQDVDIYVQKVRYKHLGRPGLVTLKYDKVVGRYFQWTGPNIEGDIYADQERRS